MSEKKYSPTIVTDNFPLKDLECQYYDICRCYTPGKCAYGNSCNSYLTLQNDLKIRIRDVLRHSLESFVAEETMKFQVKMRFEEGK